MKAIFIKIYQTLVLYRFKVKKFLNPSNHKKMDWFYADLKELKRQKGIDGTFEFGSMYPILTEKNDEGVL